MRHDSSRSWPSAICLSICLATAGFGQDPVPTTKPTPKPREKAEKSFFQGGMVTLALRPLVLKELRIDRDSEQFKELTKLKEAQEQEFFQRVETRVGEDAT